MPELRRFAPNVPIVLVGTKLGMTSSSQYSSNFCVLISSALRYGLLFFLADLRDDKGYLADHMGSNVITSAQVCIMLIVGPNDRVYVKWS